MIKELGRFYLSDENDFILGKYEEVNRLLGRAYWVKDRSDDMMRLAMEHSLNYAIFERDTGRLAGFARVITDFATMYYLSDVIIDEDFRGMGLGKALVGHIVMDDERLQHIGGSLKTKDAQSLYARFGFAESDVTYMFQKRQ